MKQKFILLITLLFFISCSQKNPKIDGQINKFAHHFYPAKVDGFYAKDISADEKYPLIFLFEGFYGEWRKNAIVTKLQALGYNVVTIGYFDKAGISNNLSRINLNGLKKVMDSYKYNLGVDDKAIGVIGRGKGAELALVMGSLYSDIKMVVSIVGSHVVMQSSQFNFAHHSSWMHDDKELDFVPFTLASWETIKGAVTLLFEGKGYNEIHLNAFNDREAVAKARIKVENINGSIYVIANKNDNYFPSVLMGKEIVQRLKDKKFAHHHKYQEYNSSWYLQSHSKEWNDVYMFVTKNLKSRYTPIFFNFIDKDENKEISKDEYVLYREFLKKNLQERENIKTIYNCDKNYDKKIGFYEVKDKSCSIVQYDFHHFDLNSDKFITEEELNYRPKKVIVKLTQQELKKREEYRIKGAKKRVKQCDKDADKKVSKTEATSKTCKIPLDIFSRIDSNNNNFLNLDEIIATPTKYAKYRNSLYTLSKEGTVVYREVNSGIGRAYYECDTNNDKQVDEAEVTAKSCGFTAQELKDVDINRDGVYSKKDLIYIYNMHGFNDLDANKNGVLDFGEVIELY